MNIVNEAHQIDVTQQPSIKSQIISHRLDEMAAREKILDGLRFLNLGARATKLFCEAELAYTSQETRHVLSSLDLIVTSETLVSSDPMVRLKIEKLRDWRKAQARSQGIPAYRVLSNRVLLAMASKCPKTPDSLRELKGFGRKSADTYGLELINLLRS